MTLDNKKPHKQFVFCVLLMAAPVAAVAEKITSPQGLTLPTFIKQVAEKNARITFQKLEWSIAKEQVRAAESVYEPILTASYTYTDSKVPNTTEEQFRRGFSAEFIEKNHDAAVGLEGTAPSGAKLKLSVTQRKLANNIQPNPLEGREYRNVVGVSVTQPILKGFGREVTEASWRVAEAGEYIAAQSYREALLKNLSDASLAYWDLYLAQEKTRLREESVRIAEEVVTDDMARARLGRIAQTAVLESEAGLAQRQALLLEARQEVVAATNALRQFVSEQPDDGLIVVTSRLLDSVSLPDSEAMLENALKLRPEYLASKKRAEREQISVSFAEDGTQPQLDLNASYGLNGLDRTLGSSWQDTFTGSYPSWYVGVEYRMGLEGDKKARAELAAARYRKSQAVTEIRNAEASISNSIDTTVHNLRAAIEQLALHQRVVENNRNLLGIEMARFESGQSNGREVLDREDMLKRALEIELESRINTQKARVALRLAEGSLLQQYGLEH